MVKQARTYLVGAVSGVTLIGVAIAVFVVLVSAQVFKDWPIASLGGDDNAAVSEASKVTTTADSAAGTGKTAAAGTAAGATGADAGSRSAADAKTNGGRKTATAPPSVVSNSDVPDAASEEATSTNPPSNGGESSNSGSDEGTPSTGVSNPGGNPTTSPTGTTSGTGTGAGTGTKPTPPVKVPPVSSTATETVNGAVNGVDETVTGGALKETGVTGVTEGVVNGVAGPESTVGKAVDETVNAVGGLLGGGK